MPYFLSNENLEIGKEVKVEAEEARHILLSHRVKLSEKIKLQGPNGKRFFCEVVKLGKKDLFLKVLEEIFVVSEPLLKLSLCVAYVSEKALDLIFQKSTELGVSKILLFNSENSSIKLTEEIYKKKLERWQKIFIESAKQSERVNIPEINFYENIKNLTAELTNYEKIFIADINGGSLKPSKGAATVAFIIGPEGGFSKNEMSLLESVNGIEKVKLSSFVLRTETAAIAAASVCLN